MATVSTFKVPNNQRKFEITGPQLVQVSIPVVNDTAQQNDDIAVVDIPPGFAVNSAMLHHSATLGASATAQLRATTAGVGSIALTGATTAGGASTVAQTVIDTPSATVARTLDILIAGAKIAQTATIVVSFVIAPVTRHPLPLPLAN